LKLETIKYKNRYELKKHNPSAFSAAKRLNLLETFYPAKGNFRNIPYSKKEIIQKVKNYSSKSELKKKEPYLYRLLLSKKIFANLPNDIRKGKVPHNKKWTIENLQGEALKYSSRTSFMKCSHGAYCAAKQLGIFEQICSHMGNPKNEKWEDEELKIKALKYTKRSLFQIENRGAYKAAHSRNMVEQICSHMKRAANISGSEEKLFNLLKQKYPKIQRLRIRKKDLIPNKPHISGFEIDIYAPELRKGIEFDGKYWHSLDGLKRSRGHWPEEDVKNYHKIKDEYFKSKGIQILHIKEEDWLKDSKACIDKCLEFLK
jgi:hypothetical protein